MRLARAMAGLALGTIALTTACCGSSSPKTTSINPAADRATAKAINLKASDLPGWKQSPNTTTSADQATSSRLAACAGAQSPSKIDVVDVSSPNFDQGQTEVSSDVTMVRTHADGLADLKALTSSKLNGCVQQIAVPALNQGLPSGATVSNLQISAFTPSGAPRDSFGLRITLSVNVPQQGAVPLDVDTIGFLDGRAEVELDAAQTGGGNPSTSLEQELLSFLVTRAQQ